MNENESFCGKPCRKNELLIGNTLFTVISVQSDAAKETPMAKIQKLILSSALRKT